MEIGRLNALITADDRDFTRKMEGADRKGKSTANSLKSTFANTRLSLPEIKLPKMPSLGGLGSVLGGNLLSGGISAILSGTTNALKEGWTAGIDYQKMLEGATVRLSRFFDTASQTDAFVNQIKKFATASPIFNLDSAVTGAQRLLQMGYAANQVEPMLKSLGDAVGAAGGGPDEINRITAQFAQAINKQKLLAEDLQVVAEANVPVWDALARAIGKSVAETQKLAAAGQIDAKMGVQGIIANLGEMYAGQSEKAANTLAGRESVFADTLNQQLAAATQGNFEQLKKAYAAATEGLATEGASKFAGELNKLLSAMGNDAVGAVEKLASGESFTKAAQVAQKGQQVYSNLQGAAQVPGAVWDLGKAIKDNPAKAAEVIIGELGKKLGILGNDAGQSFAQGLSSGASGAEAAGTAVGGGAEKGVRDALQQHSPSQVMLGLGRDAAQSFWDGFANSAAAGSGRIQELFDQATSLAAGNRPQRRQTAQERSEAALQSLIEREPAFVPKLKEIADRLQTRPEWLLQVMAFETAGSFDPAKRGPGTATGLIQFLEKTAKSLGTTTEALAKLSATDQLDWVEKYFAPFKGQLDSLGANYNAVAGGFRRGMTDESTVYSAKGSPIEFAANQGWNTNQDEKITRGELAAVAAAALSTEQALRALQGSTQTANQQQTQTAGMWDTFTRNVSSASESVSKFWDSLNRAVEKATGMPLLKIETTGGGLLGAVGVEKKTVYDSSKGRTSADARTGLNPSRRGDERYAFPLIQTAPAPPVPTFTPKPFDFAKAAVGQGGLPAQQMQNLANASRALTTALTASQTATGATTQATQAATQEAGKYADAIKGTGDALQKTWQQLESEFGKAAQGNLSTEARFERFKDFQARLGQGFDDVISSLIEGGGRWKDALANLAKDFFGTLSKEFMLQATGGTADSLGKLLGNIVGNLLKSAFGALGGGVNLPILPGVPIPAIASGGIVSGPGTSTSDSIPAWLSNGEFVVNARAVQTYGRGFLEKVNDRRLPAFAMGGYVGRETARPVLYRAEGGMISRERSHASTHTTGREPAPIAAAPVTVIQNFQIAAPAGTVPQRTQQQIATRAAEGAQLALRRNG